MQIPAFLKKLNIILFFFFVLSAKAEAKNPSDFITEVTSSASNILSSNISKNDKIIKLQDIATQSVDIKGIGMYTLGKYRKNLSDNQKKQYSELFEKYFLKSFASRLVEYADPKIIVQSEEVLNKNYTIVKSILVATKDRPEIKIEWRVYTKNPEKLLIRDLIIEGLSLARTQKEEFNSVISSNNDNIEALFKTLNTFIN